MTCLFCKQNLVTWGSLTSFFLEHWKQQENFEHIADSLGWHVWNVATTVPHYTVLSLENFQKSHGIWRSNRNSCTCVCCNFALFITANKHIPKHIGSEVHPCSFTDHFTRFKGSDTWRILSFGCVNLIILNPLNLPIMCVFVGRGRNSSHYIHYMDTENVYKFRRYQAVPTHPGECGLEGWREGELLETEEGI